MGKYFLVVTLALVAPSGAYAEDSAPTVAVPVGSKHAEEPSVLDGHTRHVGIMYGAGPGILAVDLEIGHFYGFASTPLPLDLFAADEYGSASLGMGATFRMRSDPRWSFDMWAFITPGKNSITAFGNVLVMAFGVGAGFHFTTARGLTLGLKFPLLGTSVALDDSDIGVVIARQGLFYLTSLLSLPLATVGFRF